jgi:signal transduction histidine kinase
MGEVLVEQEGSEDSYLTTLSRDCKTSCDTAIQTLNDMLLYDKIQSKMITLDRTRVDIAHLVYDTVRIITLTAKGKDVKVELRHQLTSEDLLKLLCSADKFKLKQVINNFFTNALKFTPAHGVITVNMKLLNNFSYKSSSPKKGANGVVRVEVHDTGAGISKENVHKLFGQYMQFNANQLQGGNGSGLGLWLSKAIIEMHDGIIGAVSEGEGCGSMFFFELPLLPASLRTPQHPIKQGSNQLHRRV